MDEIDRYSRQTLFPGIGPEGQRRLSGSFAVVVGCGALGTVIASSLVRGGVGRVRIVDRDFIEYHNLQRQLLYTERDIEENLPKATAAERHLREANSAVEVEGVVADFNRSNAEKLVEGGDVIVDGLDNFEARYLINDVALKYGIPWIYGGAIGSSGMTANFLPGGRPCFRCLVSSPPVGSTPHLRYSGGGERHPLDRRLAASRGSAEDPDPFARSEPRPDRRRRLVALVRVGAALHADERGLPRVQRHLRVPPRQTADEGHQSVRSERGPDLECRRRGHAPGRHQKALECPGTDRRKRANDPVPRRGAGNWWSSTTVARSFAGPGTRRLLGRCTRSIWGCRAA